ncbi:sodium-coupled monocarboxylate transporter 1-like protein, partial [Leptotrombidium deliense]
QIVSLLVTMSSDPIVTAVPHPEHRFSVADYCVFIGMLSISAIIGIYYAFVDRRKTTTNEFLMGGRSMGVFPVALSVLASFLSAITLLGTPLEVYNYGTQYWIHLVVYPILMYITAYCFTPVFYNLKVTSSFEIIYMAVVLYAPALALAQAGLVLFAKYWDCDPIQTKRVSTPDQLFPLFVMETLGSFSGIPGLFVSGIFSGALSTVSSGVNSLAAVTLEDYVKGYTNFKMSEKKATLITKAIAIAFGILAIGMVGIAQLMGNVLQAALGLFGLLGCPIFALYIVGMFIPFISSKGALVGVLSGLTASLWVGIGAMISKPYNPLKPILVNNCPMNNYTTNLLNQQLYNNKTIELMMRTKRTRRRLGFVDTDCS